MTGPVEVGPGEVGPVEVDARGRRCPLPVIDLARRLPELPVGGEIVLLADDPAAGADVPAWCRLRAQEYVGSRPGPDGSTAYVVRRRH